MNVHDYFRDPSTIETERLFLRRMKANDLDDVYAYAQDPKTTEFLLWKPHTNRRETRRYLGRIELLIRKGEYYDFAVVEKKSGKMIGTCGFTSIHEKTNCAEIGYVLSPEFWGNGYAAEALKTVISIGFNLFDFDVLYAEYFEGNERSRRVAEKCGMKTGVSYSQLSIGKRRSFRIERAEINKEEYKNKS